METFVIYTDGSSVVKNNKRYGGIGIYFENTKQEIFESFMQDNSTNQRMELQACLTAIKSCLKSYFNNIDKINKIIIRTDSQYTIDCITKWSNSWIKNNWLRKNGNRYLKILHLDLIKELYDLYHKYDIKYEHVRSHQKQPDHYDSKEWLIWYGNYKADKLAKEGIKINEK